MLCRSFFSALCALVTAAAPAGGPVWQQLRDHGAEVYYADRDLRAELARRNPGALPETRRRAASARDAAFDWSKLIPGATVRDQKDSSNCWAYAAVGAFEWNWAIRNGGLKPPALAVQPSLDRTGKNGNGYAGWALEDLLKHGTCAGNSYPLVGRPSTFRPGVTMRYRLAAWGMVEPRGGLPSTEALKRAIAEFGPVVANVCGTPAFNRYRGGVFAEHARPAQGEPQTNHLLVIVGWDDRKGKAGCWRVQNSAGTAWGERGFMWIEYGSNNVGHSACWLLAQATQYDLPEGIHRTIGPDADPFPHWPGAVRITPAASPNSTVLSAVEVPEHLGERAVVSFKVQGGEVHSSEGHAELFSAPTWRQADCVIVRILKGDLGKFPPGDATALVGQYRGKTIRVRGTLQPHPAAGPSQTLIEVAEPAQIEVID